MYSRAVRFMLTPIPCRTQPIRSKLFSKIDLDEPATCRCGSMALRWAASAVLTTENDIPALPRSKVEVPTLGRKVPGDAARPSQQDCSRQKVSLAELAIHLQSGTVREHFVAGSVATVYACWSRAGKTRPYSSRSRTMSCARLARTYSFSSRVNSNGPVARVPTMEYNFARNPLGKRR